MFKILTVLLFVNHTYAQDQLPGWEKLEAIAMGSSRIPVQVTYEFLSLENQRPLVALNAEMSLSPASVTKLLTAGAVLHQFTPAKTFETKFFYSGDKRGGVIFGDLFVVGDGDPFIVSERLWQMAADLRQMGIEQIRGDIVVDNSLFDDELFDESRRSSTQRSMNAYDAPVSALGINFNTVTVSVLPSTQAGQRPVVSIDPYLLPSILIQNQATTKKNSANGLLIERIQDRRRDQTSIKVTGSIGRGLGLSKQYRSINDPVTVAADYIRTFLSHEGIKVLGKSRQQSLPKNAKFLYSFSSYPMQKMIDGLNKFSNNYIADVLTKRLGAEVGSASQLAMSPGSGSLQNGLNAMIRFLDEEVKVSGSYVLKNGSGLNDENRISARQLNKLLAYMEKRLDLFPEFVASLPASGWDGTLKRRFRQHSNLLGGVRAKTGSLSEPVAVSSLAGYFRHPKHGLCAFTIIQNGVLNKAQPNLDDLRHVQDELLTHFIEKM